MLELLDRAPLSDLKISYDTSHILNSGTSVAESLRALGPRLAHVALRDAVQGGQFCTPGDGEFDFAALFHGLEQAGYPEELVLELEPSAETPATDCIAETLRGSRLPRGIDWAEGYRVIGKRHGERLVRDLVQGNESELTVLAGGRGIERSTCQTPARCREPGSGRI